ncbi:MAG: 50S ribosomal protein L23 [Phycisphaeraceae bacterium]|nr:50S ribosomal protein L23 [Phycisphaeraceae bacterium]
MHATHVIKKPVVTEKGTFAMNELNRYTFQVDLRASKDQIRKAVEDLYKVKVEKVNTQTRKGKMRRYRYGLTQESTIKLASVRLKDGDTIELF